MEKKGLQKLTDSQRKVLKTLDRPRVTKADIKSFSKKDMQSLDTAVNDRLDTLRDEALDRFIEKVSDIITPESKNIIWENNHRSIVIQISEFIDLTGRMPTMFELSDRTGLSRQTLSKHLKEYRDHPQYLVYLEQFRFMGQRVLSKMFKLAVNGDVRAGRLYLEMVGGIMTGSGKKGGQTNYIQINNTILTQENIQSLPKSQLERIEDVLREFQFPKAVRLADHESQGVQEMGLKSKRDPSRVPFSVK
jgi:hypothetical protein